jgi:hypothetical protein
MALPSSDLDKQKLQQLRELLLIEDRKTIADIQHVIETREDLAQRVDPIIEEHLEELEKNFPDAYIRVVQKLVDDRMRQQQDELINLIYPRLGIMIKKFINSELRLLREKVDQQIRLSPLSFIYKNRNKSSAEILLDLTGSKIEEVYVISHESGLLLGSASASETADKDMIAGMLTAIKAFVEDAFKRTDEELRAIQYGSYEIMVQNFFNYYIAIAIAGTLSELERDVLTKKMLDFAHKELRGDLQEPEVSFYAKIEKALHKYFIQPYKPSSNGQ